MSLKAARLVKALINALLYGVSNVVGTIKTAMRGPRDRDDDEDSRRPRGGGERRTGDTNRPDALNSASAGTIGVTMGVARARLSRRAGDMEMGPKAWRGSRSKRHLQQIRGPTCVSFSTSSRKGGR
jgi:hypothetical protein